MPPYTEQQRAYWMSAFACGPPLETRFTITSGINGQGYWYNRRSGAMVGTVVGSLSLQGLGPIDRVGTTGGDLLVNKGGAGGFSEWVAANPELHLDADIPGPVRRPLDCAASGQLGRHPGRIGFIRFTITAAQLNLASNVSTGDSIEVVITP